MLALLSHPFLFEPTLGLRVQSELMTIPADPVPVMPPKKTEDELTVPLWTDHFSSLFPLLHY